MSAMGIAAMAHVEKFSPILPHAGETPLRDHAEAIAAELWQNCAPVLPTPLD